ncbi:MAG TPA: hypothetical protein VK983_03330 [Candidatus Limnocylindrales bacterium]|nr:hypothetical protein [Candidatus Limnocylindrales bacterium]
MATSRHLQLLQNEPMAGERATPDKVEAARELERVVGASSDVLVRASTVFPLTLFPDTVSVDRTKLTITHREFFKAAEVLSISLADILNVTATVGPFFGSIVISTRFFDPGRPYVVDHFWRADALRIKRIAQGFIIARQKDIDTSVLSTPELSQLLDELGKVGPEEKV